MADNTVTKTIQDVDKLFPEIILNGQSYESDRYTPVPEQQTITIPETQNEHVSVQLPDTPETPETVQGQNVCAVELNSILHNLEDSAIATGLAQEITDRMSADAVLQCNIDNVSCCLSDEITARQNLGSTVDTLQCGLIAERDARINADGLLQNGINCVACGLADEITARQSLGNTVSCLQTGLADEATARCNADTCLHNDIGTVAGNLNSEINARCNADNTLQCNIDDEASARCLADETLQCNIDSISCCVSDIETLIPNQATCQNQLADKDFVNSSIATNTANFLGTYTSMAQIEAIPDPTNNDYVFLATCDSAGNAEYDRYKYSADCCQWLFEYELNNSSFTAEQWATINSGLTQASVDADICCAVSAEATARANAICYAICDEVQDRNNAICSAIDTEVCDRNTAICNAIDTEVCDRNTAISTAIGNLDVGLAGGSGCYICSIQQTNGVISVGVGSIDSTVTQDSTNLVTSGAVFTALANASIGNAETACCLKTARDLKVCLSSTSAQSFNGSANATCIGVAGTLPVANGGTGRTTTASGAMYATSSTSGLLMGTLPVAQGGTGQTDLSCVSVGYATCASSVTKLAYTGVGNGVVTAYQTARAWCGSVAEWASYLIFNHGDGSCYYNQMIRMPFNGVPKYQRKVNGTNSGWYSFITSENIGSQSVRYATCVYADQYTGNCDRNIVVTSSAGGSCAIVGAVASGCDFTYNPATGMLKLKSNGKTACLSHQNASYFHIYTDASEIAFNKSIYIPDGCYICRAKYACCASYNGSGVAFGTASTCASTAFLSASGCAVDSAKLGGKALSSLASKIFKKSTGAELTCINWGNGSCTVDMRSVMGATTFDTYTNYPKFAYIMASEYDNGDHEFYINSDILTGTGKSAPIYVYGTCFSRHQSTSGLIPFTRYIYLCNVSCASSANDRRITIQYVIAYSPNMFSYTNV